MNQATANPPICLSATNVQKRYGENFALKDVTLQMFAGEILALLGANGSGKTTFIKILATLLNRDGGRVEILGHDLDRNETEIRRIIGYVGQDTERSAYARLTVQENLRFFGKLRGLSQRQIDGEIEKLSSYFDFDAHLTKQFMQLSGGQKQTVVIMRALLHNPVVIYLDEPTKGLDPIISQRIRVFLKDYVSREKKSLLLTSHILTEVDELADRVALICQGTIPVTGTPDDLKDAVGSREFIEFPKTALPRAVEERLLGLDSVRFKFDRNPDQLTFGISDFFQAAEEIIPVLKEAGVTAGFHHRTVSLEDAFIHHIGMLNERFE